jgi:hypothetical protein
MARWQTLEASERICRRGTTRNGLSITATGSTHSRFLFQDSKSHQTRAEKKDAARQRDISKNDSRTKGFRLCFFSNVSNKGLLLHQDLMKKSL